MPAAQLYVLNPTSNRFEPAGPNNPLSVIGVRGTGTTGAVSVGTTPTLLHAADDDLISLTVFNNGADPVYLGGATVTTATGIPVAAGQARQLVVTGEAWYGVVATGTADVRVLSVVR